MHLKSLDAEEIKEMLKIRNLKYGQIADVVGVHQSYVCKVLNGSSNRWVDTSDRILKAIADAIDVNICQLNCTPNRRAPNVKLR